MRETGFGSIEKMLRRAGAGVEEIERLRQLWEATPEVSEERYESIVTLLRVFARQLGDSAAGILLQAAPQEPDAIRRARHYVRDHLGTASPWRKSPSMPGSASTTSPASSGRPPG